MASQSELEVDRLASLAWMGDDLIDWIGGRRIELDGTVTKFGCGYSYRFDSASGLDDIGVMVETLGTKGRLARWNGEVATAQYVPVGFDQLRELDRSYYQCEVYAYPACVLTLPDGRTALAHCPRSYDTLELELLDGTPLTLRTTKSEDVFHSRLAASADGRWLLSCGWVWHPCNIVCVYDVARALVDPSHLSTSGLALELGADYEGEVDAAVLSGDRVIVSASADCPMLSVVDLPSGKNLSCHKLAASLGTRLVAWGPDHVVALDGNPRVVSLHDGSIVETLELETGSWHQPSVNLEPPVAPYAAIDPRRPRFAIGDAGGRIVIVTP